MIEYGLIGKSLLHSYSQNYFHNKFKKERLCCKYSLFELDSLDEIPILIKEHPNLMGLNVTIPYKTQIIPYLDYLDPDAERIGGVNVVKILRQEDLSVKLHGFNTDWEAWKESLTAHFPVIAVKSLIIGNGGVAKAVRYALDDLNIPYKTVSRHPSNSEIAYTELNRQTIQDHRLIINCTPLGMFPCIHEKPNIPYEAIGKKHFIYDLVYNPRMTAFIKKCKQQGAYCFNGLKMFELQAEKTWAIWK